MLPEQITQPAPGEPISSYPDYTALRITVEAGVATVTIDHPPVNVLGLALIGDLARFAATVRHDEQVRVIVVQSSNPDFFVAHVDMELINQGEAFVELAALYPEPSPLNIFQQLHEQWRTLPQVTIAKLSGLARCGGNELVMALDMRFAAQGRAGLGQTEVLHQPWGRRHAVPDAPGRPGPLAGGHPGRGALRRRAGRTLRLD